MKKALLIVSAAVMVSGSLTAAVQQKGELVRIAPSNTFYKSFEKTYGEAHRDASSAVDSKRSSAAQRVTRLENDKYWFMPVVDFPGGAFWMNGLAYEAEDGSPLWSPVAVLPSNTPLTFGASTWIAPLTEGTPTFDDRDGISISWSGLTSIFDAEKTTGTGVDFSISLATTEGVICPLSAPAIDWKYGDLSYNSEGNDMRVVTNTVRELPVGGQSEKFESIFLYPYTNEFVDYFNCSPLQVGKGTYTELDGVAYSYSGYAGYMAKMMWAEGFKEKFNEELKSADVKGLGFNIGYSAPYALKSLKVQAWCETSAATTIDYTLKKGTEESNEVIYKGKLRVTPVDASISQYPQTFELTFDSEEDGIPVDYIMIDGPLMVEFSGLSDLDMFAPMACGYENYSQYVYGYNAYSIVDLAGETAKYDDVVSYPQGWVFGEERMRALYFVVDIDAEYPSLDVFAAGTGLVADDYLAVEHESDNVYTVNISKDQDVAGFLLTTTAEAASVLYVDDESLPSWVDYSVGEVERGYVALSATAGVLQTVLPVGIQFSGEGTDRSAELKISYFNKEVTLRVVQGDAAGIAGVEAEGNGAVQYFDIQGRKLNAAPATGFFIQKQGNKVTKVIR